MSKRKLLPRVSTDAHEGEEQASPGTELMYYDNFGYTNIDEEHPQTDKIDKYVQQMAIWKRIVQKEKTEKR